MSKFLIVGLGNIGADYANTRHNIGFDVVNEFVKKNNGSFHSGRLAEVAEIKWKGKTFICILPTTYMNLSGKSFKYWMEKEKIPLERTLTIVGDLALPITKLRLRSGGSSGGHNGLSHIEMVLGTEKYPKLRFGIGNEYPKGMQVAFVLSKWKQEEVPVIRTKILASVETIENFATLGIDQAMNLVNNKIFI